jgi:hypothetical protein
VEDINNKEELIRNQPNKLPLVLVKPPSTFQANANWFVFALTINNSIWGLVSYFILNYCDALWLNLTFVLAMGLTWPAELLIKHLQLVENLDTTFSATKVFILIGLLAVCIGYEFENQEEEEKKEK